MTAETGFMITFLRLESPDGREAVVTFGPGLNVVSGPSDTGKTYISQCIDYLLGAGSPPKEIPESEGFTEAVLGIKPTVGQEFTLSRRLSGGEKIGYTINGEEELVDAQHEPGKSETVSHLLCALSGLDDKVVRMNVDGKTREMSFRDVARLVVITEGAIIRDQSPILTGQWTNATTEKSIFRVLLDGDDDSGVEERVAPKILKQRRDGQRELLEGMLASLRQKIADTSNQQTEVTVRDAHDAAERAMEFASLALGEIQAEVSSHEQERSSTFSEMHALRSQGASAGELHRRFILLQAQYSSDIDRLEATAEAGDLLASMTEERCPVCGSETTNHDPGHVSQSGDPESVAAACRAEAGKVKVLLGDLQATIDTSNEKVRRSNEDETAARQRLEELEQVIGAEYQPKVDAALESLGASQDRLGYLRDAIALFEREADLLQKLATVNAPTKRPPKVEHPAVRRKSLEDFSLLVGKVLADWNFPDSGRVVWSEADTDLLIGGKPRGSFGKGVRALTHAAFSLALLQYAGEHDRGHPGFVILDSPLVVYREPDLGEGGDKYDVKVSFYRSVAANFADRQVIVLENEDPPADLISANVITFTGGDHGRQGFVPKVLTQDN